MIPGIQITSSEMMIRTEGGKPSLLPFLKNNQLLKAQVLTVMPPEEAELMVNGQKLAVKTRVPLNPGEHIQVKVAAQKDGFLLKLTGQAEPSPRTSLTSALQLVSKGAAPLKALFRTQAPQLAEILDQIALKSDVRDDNFLPRLLEKGGMTWETKLANVLKAAGPEELARQLDQLISQDFKGAALRQAAAEAQAQKPTAPLKTAGPEELARQPEQISSQDFKSPAFGQAAAAVKAGPDSDPAKPASVLQTLESLQQLNTASSESGRYLIPFPVLTEAGFNLGQLLIDIGEEKGQEGKEKNRVIRLAFLLDMTQLGPVRADFSVLNKAITGRFLFESRDSCDFVAGRVPELKKNLEKLGYTVHLIECRVAEPSETQANALMESLFKDRENQVLNIII